MTIENFIDYVIENSDKNSEAEQLLNLIEKIHISLLDLKQKINEKSQSNQLVSVSTYGKQTATSITYKSKMLYFDIEKYSIKVSVNDVIGIIEPMIIDTIAFDHENILTSIGYDLKANEELEKLLEIYLNEFHELLSSMDHY